ncbi:MAG: hypothetical protein R6V58_12665, partial [Planctomycetota bacterium]
FTGGRSNELAKKAGAVLDTIEDEHRADFTRWTGRTDIFEDCRGLLKSLMKHNVGAAGIETEDLGLHPNPIILVPLRWE